MSKEKDSSILNQKKLADKINFVDSILDANPYFKAKAFRRNATATFFHYTTFEKLFLILENDELWASLSRFSNDRTEDTLPGESWLEETSYSGDNYIICFSNEGNLLSQWRGYCPTGGATIEFDMMDAHTYSLLGPESEKQPKNGSDSIRKRYWNCPIDVIYWKKEHEADVFGIPTQRLNNFFKYAENRSSWGNLQFSDMIPYFKNGHFFEEDEARLVFDNSDGALDECIKFRKLSNGTMVPYVVVKYGDTSEDHADIRDREIKNMVEAAVERTDSKTIRIPYGKTQVATFRKVSAVLETKKKAWELYPKRKPNIICDGHLPIVGITVSPAPNQEYQREVIERYCRSKYWLQNVKVTCSPIPYMAPTL